MSNGYILVLFLTPLMVGAAGAFMYWYTGLEYRAERERSTKTAAGKTE